jgi:hypothetical protein
MPHFELLVKFLSLFVHTILTVSIKRQINPKQNKNLVSFILHFLLQCMYYSTVWEKRQPKKSNTLYYFLGALTYYFLVLLRTCSKV